MKKVLCALLVLCLCAGLLACGKPSEAELREELTTLLIQDSFAAYSDESLYFRVSIDNLEADGENQWKADGTINFSSNNGDSVAVYYTTTLRYDASEKTYSTETVFGNEYVIK